MTLELVPHTKRRGMTKARAAKIFLARNGICFNCRQQIRQGDGWFIEHPESLAQGGSDADEDLWPSHTKCKAKKDATDAASKAKRDRIVTAGWADRPASKLRSAPFPSHPKQKTATRPIIRRSEQP
jgi:hypothetical protein